MKVNEENSMHWQQQLKDKKSDLQKTVLAYNTT